MGGYWTRQRLLLSLILAIAVAGITGFLFVSPYLEQYAVTYNEQSIYKNTDADFIAPEPSFEQISELPGQNGIEAVFPFYLTKTEVKVNDKSRITTVLLSDQFQNVDMTMYNDKRLLSKESEKSENPIWVDWQFCHDTTSGVGDTVSFSIGGNNVNYTITAVYETNSIYDGGAILAEISTDQKNAIAANAKSNGYSGMYISASDYSVCRTYLTMDYRPLGRLKDQSQFDSEEQYKIHYDAIMSSGYANEITDFKIRQNDLDPQGIIEIRELILKLNRERGITFLISSHILDELSKIATNYGFIDKGHIVRQMSSKELKKECRKSVRMKVSDVGLLTKVMEEKGIEYKVIDNSTADVYSSINFSEIAKDFDKVGCSIFTMEEHDESLEAFYLSLLGGGENVQKSVC